MTATVVSPDAEPRPAVDGRQRRRWLGCLDLEIKDLTIPAASLSWMWCHPAHLGRYRPEPAGCGRPVGLGHHHRSGGRGDPDADGGAGDALQAGGINIFGEGKVEVTGESDDTDGTIDTNFGNLNTAEVDLSAVTLAASDADDAVDIRVKGPRMTPDGTLLTDANGDRVAQTIIGTADNDDACRRVRRMPAMAIQPST